FSLPQGGDWTNSPFAAAPIFADLNGDRKDELIVAVPGGKLVAYTTAANGAIVPFRTYDTGPHNPNTPYHPGDGRSGFTRANIKSTPVVLNLPNGHKGIFAALGRDESHPGSIEDGRVFGWDALTGQVLPGWPQDTGLNFADLYQSGVTGPIASGDLDG